MQSRRQALKHLAAWSASGLSAVTAAPGWAAVGGLPNAAHTDSSPEWDRLRDKLFPGRKLERDTDRGVQLVAPLRAAYGASVPVKLVSKLPQTEALYVRRLTVVVDKNPSAVAARFDLTPEIGQADFEMRLRVDEYSHVRVVSELSDGRFFTDSRYIKTSGGCSAPPNRDALAMIGRTAFKLPEGVHINQPTVAEVTVIHPNDTGFELNQQTLMYIPSHFVRSLKVSYAGRPVFDADLDFSISENPSFRFRFVPHGPGELRAEVEDSHEGRFTGSLAVSESA